MYPNQDPWGAAQGGPQGPPPGYGQQGWGAPPQQWGAPAQQQGWGQQSAPQPAAPAVTPPSADDFMTGGHRSAKFDTFGQVIGGEIVEAPKVEQQTDPKTRAPQFYPSGDPKWVMLVAVQAQPADADDDGIRTLYVKGDMKRAAQKAVSQAGAARLEVGGTLQVRYVRDEPNSSGAGLPKKCYEARYRPPASAAVPQASPAARASATQGIRDTDVSSTPRPAGQTAFDDEPPY